MISKLKLAMVSGKRAKQVVVHLPFQRSNSRCLKLHGRAIYENPYFTAVQSGPQNDYRVRSLGRTKNGEHMKWKERINNKEKFHHSRSVVDHVRCRRKHSLEKFLRTMDSWLISPSLHKPFPPTLNKTISTMPFQSLNYHIKFLTFQKDKKDFSFY